MVRLFPSLLIAVQEATGEAAPDAAGAAAESPSMLPLLLGFAAIFYFIVFLPERKRRKQQEAMLGGIKKGDKVVTTSGIHATVAQASDEHVVVLQISDGVRVKFSRSAVQSVIADEVESKD